MRDERITHTVSAYRGDTLVIRTTHIGETSMQHELDACRREASRGKITKVIVHHIGTNKTDYISYGQ